MPFAPSDSADLAAWYDFGDTSSLIKGTYDLDTGGDYFSRSSTIPWSGSGSVSVIIWFRPDSTGVTNNIIGFDGGASTARFGVGQDSTNSIIAYVQNGGSSAFATVSGIVANRWHCVIGVFASSTSRAVYLDTNTTGASNTTSVSFPSVNRIQIGGDSAVVWGGYGGKVGAAWVFPVDLSGAGNSSIRQAIFDGEDPEVAIGSSADAKWALDNALTDGSGNGYDLTGNGTPTAENALVVARDKSGNSCHLRATTSAPTWSSTAFSNYGGAAFSRASSQFLSGSTLPVTAAPLQVFAAARSSDTTNGQDIWNLAKSSTNNNFFLLEFRGDVASDPVFWLSNDGSSNGVSVVGYTANTDHLLYAREASSTSRAAAIDAGTEVTDTNSRSPSGINIQVVGKYGGLAGGSALDGQIGGIVILDTASTDEKTNFEGWFDTTYTLGLGITPALELTVGLEGTATVFGALAATMHLSAGLEGDATLFGALAESLSSGLVATATLSGDLTNPIQAITLGLEAQASIGATLTGLIDMSVGLAAEASHGFFPGVTIQSGAGLEAEATLGPALQQLRQIVNPTYAGDSVEIDNAAAFLLTVNTTPVDLSNPYFNMEELDFTYDGKSLTFSEVATPTMGRPTFPLEGNVELKIDFNDGDGLVTYFTGQLTRRTHEGINNAEAIRYSAEGIQTLANRITLVNTTGRPQVTFTVGTTVITIVGSTQVTTTFAKTVRSACVDLFTIMNSVLTANSLSSEIYTPSLAYINADLPETVDLTNIGFASAIQEILDNEPGKKWYWDDTIQKWTVVDLLNAVTLVTRVESSQITELVYDMSTQGRYTAIRLLADVNIDDNIITKAETLDTQRGTFNISRTEVSLTPYWNPSLENTWNYFTMFEPTSNDFETDYFWCFRRWTFPQDTPEYWPGTPIKFKAKQLAVQGVTSGDDIYRWETFKAHVDWKRRTVTANNPILTRLSNPYAFPGEPGRVACKAPSEIVMTYYPYAYINGTVVTSVSTDGSITTVNTQFDTAFLANEIRYPASGYQGTAYTLFDVQRELVQLVSPTEVTTENAAARLSVLKDVVISGDIPFAGDPVKEFLNLNRTIQVSHATKDTGIATLNALMFGYRYSFGKPGTNRVEVSTDRANLIKV